LAAIFLYLSVDEAASFHENLGFTGLTATLKSLGDFHGLLSSWVMVGAIFVLIVAVAYLRFLAALPVRTHFLFIIAGALYVGGALGVEILGYRYVFFFGEPNVNFTYFMFVAIEEGLEMLGVVVFLYALLSHLASSMTGVQILIENGPTKRSSYAKHVP
jgi:hypothetical protein